jgi:hypothetical protein
LGVLEADNLIVIGFLALEEIAKRIAIIARSQAAKPLE